MIRSMSFALCLLLLSSGAAGDSFRCGRKVVRVGDSGAGVLSRCGQPLSKDRGTAEVWLDNAPSASRVKVERWHYRLSTRRLGRVVLLYQGRVVGIDVQPR